MELLERKTSFGILTAALRVAQSGRGKLVLISGEAGIGKTSLVQCFLREQHSRVRNVIGYCEPLNAPQPLAPFDEIARRLGGSIRDCFEKRGVQQRLFQEFCEGLAKRPTIVVVEDMHWADEASIDFVKFLGRRIHDLPLLLLATHRNDEMDHAHPLKAMLASLATNAAVCRIELERLSPDGVARLAQGSHLLPQDIYQRTGGNPFLVTETLSQGHLEAVPGAVRELVAGRLAHLTPASRRLAQVTAVLGHPEATLLHGLVPEAVEATEACIAAGLLHIEGESIGFRHDLLRQVVLESISPPLLLRLNAEVLSALIQAGSREAARLAHHAHGARDKNAIMAYAPLAARQAAAAGSHREAAAQYALALLYTDEEPSRERVALLMGHGQECAALDRLSEAIESYQQAASTSRSLGERRAEAAASAAAALPLVRSGRNREADELSRRAIGLLEADGLTPELASALRVQAQLRMLDRDKAQALHFGRRSIRMAEQLGDMQTLAAATMTVGTALLVADQPEGRPYLERAMHLAGEGGFDELLAQVYLNLGSSYGEQYRFEDAERFLSEGIAFAAARDLDQYLHYMQAWRALVHLYRGRLTEALDLALRLLENAEVAAVSRIMALVAVGRARARLGQDGSEEALDKGLRLATPTGTLQRLAPVRMARAEAAWLAGRPDQTRQEATKIQQLAVSHRHQWHTGEAAFWLAECGSTEGFPNWVARPFALQIEGRWSEAAESWRSLGCPYEEARALAQGDEEAQIAALRMFEELGASPAAAHMRQALRRSGVRHLPRGPRPSTKVNALGLTARQADVLALLAQGLTNPAISRRLKISTKTVDHHVSAILTRLDVQSRKEAAAKLGALEAR